MERRVGVVTVSSGDHDPATDDCPMCVAERSGRPLAASDFLVRPDGGPPPIYDNARSFLLAEAKKALAEHDLAPGESYDFIVMGDGRPDGSFAPAAFSVDAHGTIYWTSATKRLFIARLDASVN